MASSSLRPLFCNRGEIPIRFVLGGEATAKLREVEPEEEEEEGKQRRRPSEGAGIGVQGLEVLEERDNGGYEEEEDDEESGVRASRSQQGYVPPPLPKPPAGFVVDDQGKALMASSKRIVTVVNKETLKTRSFQEACIFSVIEELAEYFAQWSYSVAFLELSFVPTVRLRSFCKNTKVERFSREMKQLIHQIEANSELINKRRATISFLPNESAVASFLEAYYHIGIISIHTTILI
ncbi:hypothetical protein V2J09_017942 [Rumex salicifolius]